MKYVKFVWEGYNENDLTFGRIYNVMEYNVCTITNRDTIRILDDKGNLNYYYLRTSYDIFFTDATSEIRSNTINEILL